MPRIQGIGSTRITNRPTGGGNIKQGLPSSIGRPANLMRFTLINAYGGLPAAPAAPPCDTVTEIAVNTHATNRTLTYSAVVALDILLVGVGWKVTQTAGTGSLVGTVESITNVGDPVEEVIITITISAGSIPDAATTNEYKFTNC